VISFRQLVHSDAEMILSWRNSPEVANYMYRNDPITTEEHQIWMSHVLSNHDSVYCRIIQEGTQPIGLMSLTSINYRQRSCEWGGYLAPAVEKGIGNGRAALWGSLRIAFEELHLNRVTVEVLSSNLRALKMYESIGFVREGILRQRAWHGSEPKDAICLAILESDWRNQIRTSSTK
jgi:UDP-4-amino-4,6-dideoxy-N-acetyl-beta-L-altrosamine N-acetyltransferase